MQANGEALGIPDVGHGHYMLDALFEAGPTVRSAMGDTPLDWLTLQAYAQATGAIDEPWEFRALRSMSSAYMEGQRVGMDLLSLPPIEWETE